MNFFKKKYPNKILSVKLEDLTSNRPKNYQRNIIIFVNLEWDQKALDFYKRKDLLYLLQAIYKLEIGYIDYDRNKYKYIVLQKVFC